VSPLWHRPHLRTCSLHFFLLLNRRPPTSPLFPYTTLFRSRSPPSPTSRSWRRRSAGTRCCRAFASVARTSFCSISGCRGCRAWRSEEHTSELQSLAYLVCRLLLEKKKKIELRDPVDGRLGH